jgi:hypothetical protein
VSGTLWELPAGKFRFVSGPLFRLDQGQNRSVRFSHEGFEEVNGVIDFLCHALERSRIDIEGELGGSGF